MHPDARLFQLARADHRAHARQGLVDLEVVFVLGVVEIAGGRPSWRALGDGDAEHRQEGLQHGRAGVALAAGPVRRALDETHRGERPHQAATEVVGALQAGQVGAEDDAAEVLQHPGRGLVVGIVELAAEALVVGGHLVGEAHERAELALCLADGVGDPAEDVLDELAGGQACIERRTVLVVADQDAVVLARLVGADRRGSAERLDDGVGRGEVDLVADLQGPRLLGDHVVEAPYGRGAEDLRDVGRHQVEGDHLHRLAPGGSLRLAQFLHALIAGDLRLDVGGQAGDGVLPCPEVGEGERAAEEDDVGRVSGHAAHRFHGQRTGVAVGEVRGEAVGCLGVQAVLHEALPHGVVEAHLQVGYPVPQEGVVPEVARAIDSALDRIAGAAVDQADGAAEQLGGPRAAGRDLRLLQQGRDVLVEVVAADGVEARLQRLAHGRGVVAQLASAEIGVEQEHRAERPVGPLRQHHRQRLAPDHRVVHQRRIHDDRHGLALQGHQGLLDHAGRLAEHGAQRSLELLGDVERLGFHQRLAGTRWVADGDGLAGLVVDAQDRPPHPQGRMVEGEDGGGVGLRALRDGDLARALAGVADAVDQPLASVSLFQLAGGVGQGADVADHHGRGVELGAGRRLGFLRRQVFASAQLGRRGGQVAPHPVPRARALALQPLAPLGSHLDHHVRDVGGQRRGLGHAELLRFGERPVGPLLHLLDHRPLAGVETAQALPGARLGAALADDRFLVRRLPHRLALFGGEGLFQPAVHPGPFPGVFPQGVGEVLGHRLSAGRALGHRVQPHAHALGHLLHRVRHVAGGGAGDLAADLVDAFAQEAVDDAA